MEEIRKILQSYGQEHLLRFYGELSEGERETLARQIKNTDWSVLHAFRESASDARGKISPIEGLSLKAIEEEKSRFEEAGIAALKAGKVAAVLLAGGQGTRLGSPAPKGTFDIGVTRPLYIFEQLIRNLQDSCRACGETVPLLIMTSEKNDGETRAFFEERDYFGYPADKIRFFVQDMAPSVDLNGKALLEEKGSLALSPNGNGGWYSSLCRAGLLSDPVLSKTEWFNVFSVDNVLQRIADPVFVGATVLSGKASGAKVVRKTRPEERVGVLCLEDGLPSVIEYYEISPETANLRDGEGNLVYGYGVTLNYLFRAEKLREISGSRIPVHKVRKKIPYLNEDGNRVEPETENGYKFETLILDMVRLAGSCLPFEVVREREFAPVKNKTGVDSVDTARELLVKNGVKL